MISVCMATYNGEKYIREQIDSILSQLSENDELVISDDGSTDDTRKIINHYVNNYKNIIFVDGPKKGVIKNFENALSHSKGEYIFLTDQDDIWIEGKVKRVIKELSFKNKLLVLHDAYIVNKDGDIIDNSFFDHRTSRPGLIRNLLKNSYLGCCMAFRRELLDVALPFPDKIEMHDWWIGLLGEALGKVCFINEKYLMYRRHGNNVSSFHHHPLKKMITNRIYFIVQLYKRMKRGKKNA